MSFADAVHKTYAGRTKFERARGYPKIRLGSKEEIAQRAINDALRELEHARAFAISRHDECKLALSMAESHIRLASGCLK